MTPRTLLPLALLSGLPLVLGCPPLEVEDTGPEADADADSDADADADADADTDADVDTPVWEGEVRYRSLVDGNPQCDAVIDLLGSPYTGPCISYKGDQCDFGFNIDAVVVKDNGTADCTTMNPFYTYLEDQVAWFKAPILAYWKAYTYAGYTFFEDLMLTLFAYDLTSYGGGYYAGPFYVFLAYDYSYYYGTADYDYPGITWDVGYTSYSYSYYYNYYYYCPGAVFSYADETPGGKWTATGTLDTTAAFNLDAWAFTVSSEIKTPMYITVDTTDPKTGCFMGAFLNKPDGCSDVFARDNVDCTYPPSKYLCPAIDLDGYDPGEYQLVVYNMGVYDPAKVAGYQIVIDSTYDPKLHQIADDLPIFGSTFLGKTTVEAIGWGSWIED